LGFKFLTDFEVFPSRSTANMPDATNPALKSGYRGTSLIRNNPLPGSYSRIMSRAISWPWGGGVFLMSEVPLYPSVDDAPWYANHFDIRDAIKESSTTAGHQSVTTCPGVEVRANI